MLDEAKKRLLRAQQILGGIQNLDGDGDRVPYQIKSQAFFREGENSVSELAFSIPKDHAFDASKLNIYTEARLLNTTDSTDDELTFRPVDYSDRVVNTANAFAFNYQNSVELVYSLRDSMHGDLQDFPCSVLTAFSGRVSTSASDVGGVTGVSASGTLGQTPVAGWIGALHFKSPYHIDPGASLTARVTPTFSFNNEATTQKEFRITGVLHGYRVVRRR